MHAHATFCSVLCQLQRYIAQHAVLYCYLVVHTCSICTFQGHTFITKLFRPSFSVFTIVVFEHLLTAIYMQVDNCMLSLARLNQLSKKKKTLIKCRYHTFPLMLMPMDSIHLPKLYWRYHLTFVEYIKGTLVSIELRPQESTSVGQKNREN